MLRINDTLHGLLHSEPKVVQRVLEMYLKAIRHDP